MTTILITGGTGKVGRRLVTQLAGRSGVRALAHSDASAAWLGAQGVEVVRGSLDEPASVAAALDGVDRLFLLSPFTPAQAQQELAAVDAAEAAGVGHVVKLSSVLEDWDIAVMRNHAAVSARLRAADVGSSVLRPDNFMDNEAGALDAIRGGVVVAPSRDAELAFVDARDIAAVAARELTAEAPTGGDFFITGPEQLSYEAYAGRLGAGLGLELHHVSPTREEFASTLQGFGLPAFLADGLAEMFDAMAERGSTHAPTDTVERVTGRPPRDARTFAEEVLAPALAAPVA